MISKLTENSINLNFDCRFGSMWYTSIRITKMNLEIIAEKRSKKYILENIGKYYIMNFIVFFLLLLEKNVIFRKRCWI